MSTLKVTHLQNENGSGPAMSVAVGGGVTFAGISTFHNGVDSGERLTIGGSNVTDSNLLTLNGTGASQNVGIVLNKTNSPAKAYGLQVNNASGDLLFFDYTASQERVRITGVGSFGIGNNDPTYRVSVKDTKADGTGVQMHLWNNSTNNVAGNVWSGIRFTGSTADYETAEIKGWRVHPGTGLNSLSFNTGGVERMVMSSGGVGIGTNNPERTLSIQGSNAMIQIEGTGGNGKQWSIVSTDDTTGGAIGGAGDFVIYDDTSGGLGDVLTLTGVGGSMGLGLQDPKDKLHVSGGNIRLESGYGINFADYATSGNPSSNLLDDYEEGTFTPIYAPASGSITSAINQGVYVKVGNAVYFSFRIGTTMSNFSGAGGQVKISGLPFTVGSSTQQRIGGGSIDELYRWPTNFANFRGYPENGGTAIGLHIMNPNSSSYDSLEVGDMSTGTNQNIMAMTGWYTTTDF